MELPIRYLNEKGQLDDGETSQMRYVYDIMYGEGEPYHNADWSVVIYPSEVKLVDQRQRYLQNGTIQVRLYALINMRAT